MHHLPELGYTFTSGQEVKKNPNPTQKIMGIICAALMCKPIIYGKMGKRKSLRRPSQVLW